MLSLHHQPQDIFHLSFSIYHFSLLNHESTPKRIHKNTRRKLVKWQVKNGKWKMENDLAVGGVEPPTSRL